MNLRVLEKLWGMKGILASEELQWSKESSVTEARPRGSETKEKVSQYVSKEHIQEYQGVKQPKEKWCRKKEEEQEYNVIGDHSFILEDLFMWNLPNMHWKITPGWLNLLRQNNPEKQTEGEIYFGFLLNKMVEMVLNSCPQK